MVGVRSGDRLIFQCFPLHILFARLRGLSRTLSSFDGRDVAPCELLACWSEYNPSSCLQGSSLGQLASDSEFLMADSYSY